jgi:hypothetical protein
VIRWFLGRRLRLGLASLGLAGVLVGLGPVATDWIWNASASHSANLLIMLGLALVLLGFGAAFGSLLGDLVFPNRWRERVLLGQRIEVPPDSLDSPAGLRGLGTYLLPYSVIIVALVLTGGWALDRVSDGFLTRLQLHGGTRTTLRGDDTPGKLEALKSMASEKRENRLGAGLELLDRTWRDPRQPPEVQQAALGALGSIIGYLSDAIDSWAYEGKLESWQRDLFGRVRKDFAPGLREARAIAVESGGMARAADLIALSGLLRDADSQAELIGYAEGADDGPLWHASVVALGRMRTFAAFEAVIPLAERPLPTARWEVLAWATQALAREFHKGRPDLDEKRLSDAEEAGVGRAAEVWSSQLATADLGRACVAVGVILHLRDSRLRDPLIAAFDRPGANAKICDTWSIDVGFGRRDYAAERGFLQRRIIDALALISLGDPVVKAWVVERRKRPEGLDATVVALLKDFNRYL